MVLRLRRWTRFLMFPWWILFLPKRQGMHPYFGPRTSPWGGADLKLRKLKAEFGNSCWPSVIYIVSGKLPPFAFLRLAAWKRIPIVLNQDGVYYPAWYTGNVDAQNKRLQQAHIWSTRVIYQSHFCEVACKKWVRPEPRVSYHWPNAVDTRHFLQVSATTTQPYRILASSYFNASNNYVLTTLLQLADALAKLPEPIELLIAGRSETAPIKHANVRWLGAYSQAEAPAVYQQAHALLHLKYMDPCPSVVLEAMACGLPVIHSNSGGTPELVADAGVALAVEQSYERVHLPDLDALLKAVLAVRGQWADFSSRARYRAASYFDIVPWMKKHRDLFQELTIHE